MFVLHNLPLHILDRGSVSHRSNFPLPVGSLSDSPNGSIQTNQSRLFQSKYFYFSKVLTFIQMFLGFDSPFYVHSNHGNGS